MVNRLFSHMTDSEKRGFCKLLGIVALITVGWLIANEIVGILG